MGWGTPKEYQEQVLLVPPFHSFEDSMPLHFTVLKKTEIRRMSPRQLKSDSYWRREGLLKGIYVWFSIIYRLSTHGWNGEERICSNGACVGVGYFSPWPKNKTERDGIIRGTITPLYLAKLLLMVYTAPPELQPGNNKHPYNSHAVAIVSENNVKKQEEKETHTVQEISRH